jgi:transposase
MAATIDPVTKMLLMQKIISKHIEGKYCVDIATDLKISAITVAKWLREHDIEPRHKNPACSREGKAKRTGRFAHLK